MPERHEAWASQHRHAPRAASLPGILPASCIAALSALVFGLWARPAVLHPSAAAGAAVSAIAEVAPSDRDAAIGTISATAAQLARLRDTACPVPLAWVTVARPPGSAPGPIRLLSGAYVSPSFVVGDTPLRVAIPYPAPYDTGRGPLAVVGDINGAVVSLLPAWHVVPQEPLQFRTVTWQPRHGCPGRSR